MFFTSDNASGVPQQVMDALASANQGYTRAYGADDWTARAQARIRDIFDAPRAEVHLVSTGTAANALAIASFTPPWGAVFCHADAHVERDECGAPEFFSGGAKLVHVAGAHGKMTPETLRDALGPDTPVGVHGVQPAMVTLTNLTEAGTAYSVSEISVLCEIAHSRNLPVHLDGARFANALVSQGCTPAQMTWRAGVDVLSLGGTKNGLMGAEAVVIFDPDRHPRGWELELRRKRAGHLWSKHRFLAAQMLAWLEGDLWLDLARHANAMAARLEAGITATPGARLVHPRAGNMVFAEFARDAHRRLQGAGAAYYMWPRSHSLDGPGDEMLSARLVASWSTTAGDVDAFVDLLGA